MFFSKLFLNKNNNIKGIKTCNIAFYKNDCININGFNNDINGWGREDSEFAVRLLNNGIIRKNVDFCMIQFHLWHQNSSRAFLLQNDAILAHAIDNQLVWCNNGLKKYL